ncbi:MAG: hydroxyisourate hydrolase [Bacteriovoracaceae bacterium]|nr:hydroxyisourate hydrolase [Bacteriovoracaceae bacterium]
MISTHILDISQGQPAKGIEVLLEMEQKKDKWVQISLLSTNSDGRIVFDAAKDPGVYRLTFKIENYFDENFFLNTPVVFQIKNTKRKYHVPLLLSPYGYSTYRGS